ncbi:MAG: sugar ABC transporter substrate-binding protein [Pseudomonadota bacterium]
MNRLVIPCSTALILAGAIAATAFATPSTVPSFGSEALDAGTQAPTAGLRLRAHEAVSELTIAVVPIAPEFRYYAEMSAGALERAQAAGATVIVDGPPGNGDDAVHAEILGQMAEREDIDAIILSLRDAAAAAPAIERAVENGIFVVLANADFTSFPTQIHAVVGYHQVNANAEMGRFASGLIDPGDQVAIVGGEPGYHSERAVRGFSEGLGTEADAIAFETSGGWNVDGGRAAGEEILAALPDVDLIWAANDNMIMGVADALDSQGRDDVILLGRDGDPTAIDMVEGGRLMATVDTDPHGIGARALEVVLAAFSDEFKGGYVPTSTSIVAHERAADNR